MSSTPITVFRGEYRWLSNFWPVPIQFEGLEFRSVEHAYQAAKSLDPTRRTQFASLERPGEAKRLGQQIRLRPDWDACRLPVMLELLHTKFAHANLRDKLIATGDLELVEGNTWGDRYWGQCPLGQGENWLGVLLMAVRADVARA